LTAAFNNGIIIFDTIDFFSPNQNNNDILKVEIINKGSHNAAITGIDVC